MSTGPTAQPDESFLYVATGTTGPIDATGPPPPPPLITLADILSAAEVIQSKEQADKTALDAIGAQSFESLRTKLIQWGVAGFSNAYPILSISIEPPSVCSDGVVRNLTDYIAFCSGKSIDAHIAELQAKLGGMLVSYANTGGAVAIVISKAQSA